MNYELDLRSPGQLARKNFFRTAAFRLLLYLLILALPAGAYLLLNGYRLALKTELDLLNAELSAKQEAVKPLELLAVRTDDLHYRAELSEKLKLTVVIESSIVEDILIPAPEGTAITYLAIGEGGSLDLRGKGASLRNAALYAQRIEKLSFIREANLESAELINENSCAFTIKATLNLPDGVDNRDQF
jgi:Tfp pilus assembly protein PilN